MTAPVHTSEHDAIMEIVAKLTEHSPKIHGVILVTIGLDGRPIVGSNFEDVAQIHAALRLLGAAEANAEEVRRLKVPSDN